MIISDGLFNSCLLAHQSLRHLPLIARSAPISIPGSTSEAYISDAHQLQLRVHPHRLRLQEWFDWISLTSKNRNSQQGGMKSQPEPGVYEKAHEIDFTSLYPSIIVRYSLSPETIEHSI